VLTANPDFELGPDAASVFNSDPDQAPYAGSVEDLERIVRENPTLHVRWKKATRIVATQSEGRLRQVVGPERKEFGTRSNLICCQGCTR
jgi:hypothetical protein